MWRGHRPCACRLSTTWGCSRPGPARRVQEDQMSADDRQLPGEPGAIRDHRVKPRGVLPRHLQTWAMIAVAGAMLLVIVITGHPSAPRRPTDPTAPSSAASTLPPDRLRRYQEQLT